jgi:hypothetical protein
VTTTFTQQFAAVHFQVANEVFPLHAADKATDSRMTS